MMFLIWPLLFYIGFKAPSISWRALAVIVVAVIPMTALYDYAAVESAARLGEDESLRWHPLVFAGDVLVSSILWFIVYCAGYLTGRWRRGRKGP